MLGLLEFGARAEGPEEVVHPKRWWLGRLLAGMWVVGYRSETCGVG